MIVNPVILCGGSGTRLWPLSRKSYQKQFGQVTVGGCLKLLGENPSVEVTLDALQCQDEPGKVARGSMKFRRMSILARTTSTVTKTAASEKWSGKGGACL